MTPKTTTVCVSKKITPQFITMNTWTIVGDNLCLNGRPVCKLKATESHVDRYGEIIYENLTFDERRELLEALNKQ